MWVSKHHELLFTLAIMVVTHSAGHSSDFEGFIPSGACRMTEMQFRLGAAIEFASKVMETLKEMESTKCSTKPEDCEEVFSCGNRSSGVYTLWPRSRVVASSVQAYCNMETDGGGWTVIQRRGDYGRGEDYFYKDWKSYKEGFGQLTEDFWIGNDLLYAFSNQKKYSVRFDLKDTTGNKRWAKYDHFWIDSEEHKYTLHVSGYKGNAGDSFSSHTDQRFSTKDGDNDSGTRHCASNFKGGWWYKDCHEVNLNGLYLNGYHVGKNSEGINWKSWLGYNYSLPFTEMKIKSFSFSQENPEEVKFAPL